MAVFEKKLKSAHGRTRRDMYLDSRKTLDSDSHENRYGTLIDFVSNMNNAVWTKKKTLIKHNNLRTIRRAVGVLGEAAS